MITGKDAARELRNADKKSVKADQQPAVGPDARAGAMAESLPPDGLTLEDYAKQSALSEAEVWRRLRRGDLVGRTQKGRLIIYKSLASTSSDADSIPPVSEARSGIDLTALPPLPDALEARPGASLGGQSLTLSSNSQEMALLLDHLSLAKEENREILRMTQESIRKVTELSDTVIEMKDSVIESKESVILALKEQLAARDHEIRTLRGQNEDLEMLARAVASPSKPKTKR